MSRHGRRWSQTSGRLILAEVLWLALFLGKPGLAAVPVNAADPLLERVYLSFLEAPLVQIPGGSTQREFVFRLPEHVRFGEGSELHLVLRGDRDLWRILCCLRVSLNNRLLFEGSPAAQWLDQSSEPAWPLSLPVAPQYLEPNWNRVTLQFMLSTSETNGPAPIAQRVWELHDADSFFTFVFARLPLFPELRRFPYSMVEEGLLRLPYSMPDADTAGVTLLVPSRQQDLHRRAVFVLGAALGKTGILRRCSAGPLSDWYRAVAERNGLLVALREELDSVPLPDAVRKPLTGLSPGQGLLAEQIFGAFPNQRRWIIVSGADAAGLENALQTLVSEPALSTLPPNPSVIEAAPEIATRPPPTAARSLAQIPVRTDQGDALSFRGIYDTEQRFSGWTLLPGLETDTGGYLDLRFRHATNLLAPESFLEVTVEGQSLGRIELNGQTADQGRARLSLPAGLAGAGPMSVVFRAHLEVPKADCDLPATQQAWLQLSEESVLAYKTLPVTIRDLSQAQTFLLSNPRLSSTVLLLPARSSLAELNWLAEFARCLGERFAALDVLWPEVKSYEPSQLPSPAELQNRRVLLLGSIHDWPAALPSEIRLVTRPGEYPDEIQIQGRRYDSRQFESSLALLNLVESPWSAHEKWLVAGGWKTHAVPALIRLLTDPASAGTLYGLTCAMDAAGRSIAYDVRRNPRESLAECLLRHMPPGLTPEETLFEQYRLETRARFSGQLNFVISVWSGLVLFLLGASRVWLLWERSKIQCQMIRPTAQQGRP